MEQLTSYLQRHGLSQREFAVMIGRSEATVSRLAKGSQRPSLDLLLSIAKVTRGEVPADAWERGQA
jgi:transcriptional regulator with XRE-family HTH domain